MANSLSPLPLLHTGAITWVSLSPTRGPSQRPWAALALNIELSVSTAGELDGLTYVKEFLGGSHGDPAQRLLVFLVNHLVPVHPLSLMQPKADEVQRGSQNLYCGE